MHLLLYAYFVGMVVLRNIEDIEMVALFTIRVTHMLFSQKEYAILASICFRIICKRWNLKIPDRNMC